MSYTDINDADARRSFVAPAGVMTTLCRDNGLGWLTPRLLLGEHMVGSAGGRWCHTPARVLFWRKNTRLLQSALNVLCAPHLPWVRSVFRCCCVPLARGAAERGNSLQD